MSRTLRGSCAAPGVVIHQDGPHDSLQITSDTLSIVVKNGGDTIKIPWARVTCHQPLDQLSGNERSDVRMTEDCVEGRTEVLRCSLSRWDQNAVQDCLGVGGMMAGY